MASITITNNVNQFTRNGEYSDFEKQFSCGDILQASDLNKINNNINAILEYINENENAWASGGNQPVDPGNPVEPGSTDVITLETAFKAFNPDNVNTELSTEERKNIEGNTPYDNDWTRDYNSIQFEPGFALFMIVASKNVTKNTYIPYDDNDNIWQGPFRVGSDNTTSNFGADDDDYNYIYCRTDSGTAPVISNINPNGTNFVNLIENNSTKAFPIDATGSGDGVTINGSTEASLKDKWADHPLGISETLPYEWQVAFKYNNQNTEADNDDTWDYVFGPICISHWGHNGTDGDGVEYIFYLTNESESSNISIKTNNKYSGDYKNPNYGKEDPDTHIIDDTERISAQNVTVDSDAYQHDDFVPEGWTDEPGEPNQDKVYQYVSVRKKNWVEDEKKSKWGHFSQPKRWNNYSSTSASNLTMTMTNDNAIVDDDTDSDGLEFASWNRIDIWNGDVKVTNNYEMVVTASINCNYDSLINKIKICRVEAINTGNDSIEINDSDNLAITGVEYNSLGYCLTSTIQNFNSNDDPSRKNDLVKGMKATITYTARLYDIDDISHSSLLATVQKQQNLQVLNFSEGETYSLMVNPNTIGVYNNGTSSNRNYVIRDGEESFNIEVLKSKGKKIESVSLLNEEPSSLSGSLGQLYVVVKENTSGGTSPNASSYIQLGNSGQSITCTVRNSVTGLVSTIKSFEVELYLIYDDEGTANTIKVDTETVDFSIKGDDGSVSDPSSILPELIQNELYTIESNNDNALIDDNTHTASALTDATEGWIEIHKANSNVTEGCTFTLIDENFPEEQSEKLFKVQYKVPDDDYTDLDLNASVNLNDMSGTQNKIYFKIVPNISFTTIPLGNDNSMATYSYTLRINHGSNNVGTKTFNLNVANISADGSFYKLIIEYDSISYDSQKRIISTIPPTIKVKKITNDGPIDQIFYIEDFGDPNLSLDSEKLYIDLGSLYSDSSSIPYYDNDDTENPGYNEGGGFSQLQLCSYDDGNPSIINVPYSENGYDITLYKGDQYQDGPEHIDCRKDGSPGNPAYSSAVVRLYCRSLDNPGKNFVNSYYYKFSDGKLYDSSKEHYFNSITENGIQWSRTIVAGDYQLWMTTAVAYGNSEFDEIKPNEWDDPIAVTESGDAEPNIDIVYLYQYYNGATAEQKPNKPNSVLYYKFSEEKLYTDPDQQTEQTEYGNGNGNENWSMKPSMRTDKDLWVIHAIACSTTDMETIPKERWSDPIIYAKKQEIPEVIQGKTGKMFYMMGNWDPSKSSQYVLNDSNDYIPLVYFHEKGYDKGYWWRLIKTNPGTNAPGENPEFIEGSWNDNTFNGTAKVTEYKGQKYDWRGTREGQDPDYTYKNEYWEKCEQYGVVITEGIFSEFAKLGSAIISGDYILSMNGYINQEFYADGENYSVTINGVTKEAPAYTWFYPYYNHDITSDILLLKELTDINYVSYSTPNQISSFLFAERNKFKNYRFIITSDKDNLDFSISNNNTGSNYFTYFPKDDGRITVSQLEDNNYRYVIDLNKNFIQENVNIEQFRGSVRKLYVHLRQNTNFIKVELECESFKPNWCVDLRTGKMIAGQGNFVVNPDGSVVAASGNFIINPDGTVQAAGGKFQIDINGNLIIDGNTSVGLATQTRSRGIFKPEIADGDYNILSSLQYQTEFTVNLSITRPDENGTTIQFPPDIIIIGPSTVTDEFRIDDNVLSTYVNVPANKSQLCFYPIYGNNNSNNYFTYNFNLMNPNHDYCKNRTIDIYIGGIFETRIGSGSDEDTKVKAYITCKSITDLPGNSDKNPFYKIFPDIEGYVDCKKILIGDSDNDNLKNIKGTHLQLTSVNMGGNGPENYQWVGALI